MPLCRGTDNGPPKGADNGSQGTRTMVARGRGQWSPRGADNDPPEGADNESQGTRTMFHRGADNDAPEGADKESQGSGQ